MMKKLSFLYVLLLVAVSFSAEAQKGYEFPDSVKYKKNVIRWNITPFILWSSNNINFSYERVLKPYRSISVNAGYFVLPSLTSGRLLDSLNVTHNNSKSGFNVSGDYRFYFKKLNVSMAPSGLYWGVYGAYYFYQFENTADILDNDVVKSTITFGGKLNIYSAGIELGYQFIIKERLSIDIIFLAPSISAYSKKLIIKSSGLDIDEENEYLQKIYNAIVARVPGFEELVSEGYTKDYGFDTSIGIGLRYMVQIGYRF
jgi:hypothetical protein